MTARVELEAGRVVPRAPAKAAATARGSPSARALSRVLAADRPNTAEWGLAVGALFLLGRYPVLFLRERLSDGLGGPPGTIWENDVFVQSVFAAAIVAVLAVALWRARPSALLRQPLLLALCAMAWVSISWSVEPATSARRALLFAGAAGVGWYVGDRFTLRQQIRMAAYVSAVGIVLSLVAVAVWPEFAIVTNWVVGLVSGVYRSRNHFAPILGMAVMACLFMMRTERTTLRPAFLGLLGASLFLIRQTGARTATVALGSALVVVGITYLVRRFGRGLPPVATGLLAVGAIGAVGGWLYANLEGFLRTMDRTVSLSGRTEVWDLNLWLSRLHPVTGWGFEAVWAFPPAIELGHQALGRYPFSSHNGYFEVLLGLGWVGFGLLCAFLAGALWQAFRLAARTRDTASLWPLAVLVYAILLNISDSYFVASDSFWALVVAASVAATEANRRLSRAAGG